MEKHFSSFGRRFSVCGENLGWILLSKQCIHYCQPKPRDFDETLRKVLTGFILLSDISQEQIDRLMNCLTEKSTKAGEVITKVGEPLETTGFNVIEKGVFAESRPESKEILLEPGNYLERCHCFISMPQVIQQSRL